MVGKTYVKTTSMRWYLYCVLIFNSRATSSSFWSCHSYSHGRCLCSCSKLRDIRSPYCLHSFRRWNRGCRLDSSNNFCSLSKLCALLWCVSWFCWYWSSTLHNVSKSIAREVKNYVSVTKGYNTRTPLWPICWYAGNLRNCAWLRYFCNWGC